MRGQAAGLASARLGVVIMGVSGSGKSTLGSLLADSLGCRFLEGDAFHSPENIEKMKSGRPLEDEDRWPWLDRLGHAVGQAAVQDGVAVAACSALKRSYRHRLQHAADAPVTFIMLSADRAELVRRLQARSEHYMPAALLESQLNTLQIPTPGESATILDASLSPAQLLEQARHWLTPLS